MHELSIATAILDQARQQWDLRPGERLAKIGLRLGDFAGVDVNSLTFCFEALAKDTAFETVTLEIERTAQDELQMAFLEFDE
jgi:hydrogenase nickel incorporation protein HypA/HybF